MKSWNILKKDADGNKYDIRILFMGSGLKVEDVGFIAKGKRKPVYLGASLTNDYGWRALNWDGRREAQKAKILEVVPEHLLLEALNDVWEKLKPSELTF